MSPEAGAMYVGFFSGVLLVGAMWIGSAMVFSHPPLQSGTTTMSQLRNGTTVWAQPDEAVELGRDGESTIVAAYVPHYQQYAGDIKITKHWYAWVVHTNGYKWRATVDDPILEENMDDFRPIWFAK